VVRVQAGLVSDISGDDWFREFSTTYVRSTSSSMKPLQYGNSKSVDIYGFMHTLHHEFGSYDAQTGPEFMRRMSALNGRRGCQPNFRLQYVLMVLTSSIYDHRYQAWTSASGTVISLVSHFLDMRISARCRDKGDCQSSGSRVG